MCLVVCIEGNRYQLLELQLRVSLTDGHQHHLLLNMSCQNCGEATTNTCTRCGESNYCDGDCQNQDWSVHKDVCKDAQLGRALQRIAQILHEVHLTFRKNTWDTPIKQIVNGAQTLTVYDGDQMQNLTYFTPFPNHLVQNDVHVKMALLTAWAYDEPYGFLHSLIVKLLQGIFLHVLDTIAYIPLQV